MNNRDEALPLVYIIMRNHNAYELTSTALSSLGRLTYSNRRIIVVDDGSDDDSADRIAAEFPDIRVLRTNRYIEYCKGLNVGIREALVQRARYVFLVNNDTKDFSENYLEEIVSAFQENPKVGLVGSWVYNYDGKPTWQGIAKNKLGVPMETPTEGFVVACEVFKAIGLLNEWLIRYFEDLDFIIRLRQAGYETRAVSSVSFAHLGGGTSSRQVFVPNYYRIRNVILFMKKHCSDRPFRWKVRTFFHYSSSHLARLKTSLTHRDGRKSVLLVGSIVAAVVMGLSMRWVDDNEI